VLAIAVHSEYIASYNYDHTLLPTVYIMNFMGWPFVKVSMLTLLARSTKLNMYRILKPNYYCQQCLP